MLRRLSERTLRQDVGMPESSITDTAPPAPPAPPAQKRSGWLTPGRIAGLVFAVVGVLLFTGVLGGSTPSSVLKALSGQEGSPPPEYPRSEPVSQNISPTQSIPIGSIGEIKSVPGFEYDAKEIESYYQEVVAHAWRLLGRDGVAEVPYFRVTMHHTLVTPEMVNENPQLGRLWEYKLRTDIPVHVLVNAWAALGNQSGDLLRVNEQIAFGLLIAVQDYFEVPNGDRGGFPYLSRAFENPIITAYRAQ